MMKSQGFIALNKIGYADDVAKVWKEPVGMSKSRV